MRKIRIGNDFTFEWTITRYGASENLASHNLACYLLDPLGKRATISYTTTGNKIKGTFEGKNQHEIGVYNLLLVENEGAANMATIDQVQAFMLVPHTYMADAEGTSTAVTLSGELSLPSNGASAYEIAVAHGFVGSETEWLASLIKPVNDYLTTATASETARTTAESGRVSAETSRVTAESGRTSAETARVSAESARATAESARVSAESARVSAENTRKSAEAVRVSAESARASEYATIKEELSEEYSEVQDIKDSLATVKSDLLSTKANMDAATSSVLSAASSVGAAEDLRVVAENARKEAETNRATAEAARVSAETARNTSFAASKATFDADAAIIAQEATKLTNLESKVSDIEVDIDGYTFSADVTHIATYPFMRPSMGDKEDCNIAAGTYNITGSIQSSIASFNLYFYDADGNQLSFLCEGTGETRNLLPYASFAAYNPITLSTDAVKVGFYADGNAAGDSVSVNIKSTTSQEGLKDICADVRRIVSIKATDSERAIFDKMLSAYQNGDCDVVFEHSTYTFASIYKYMQTLGWTWTMELPIGNGCRYYFNGSTLVSNAPSGDYKTASGNQESRNVLGCKSGSPSFKENTNFELYDGIIINNGGTYCVHDECANTSKAYRHIYKNMRMIYNVGATTEDLSKCIGGGVGKNSGYVVIEDCCFINNNTSNGVEAVSWHGLIDHTNAISFNAYIRGNYFSTKFRINGYFQNSDEVFVQYNGNSAKSLPTITEYATTYIFTNETHQ